MICECVGCKNFATCEIAGRWVCYECNNGNGPLFFGWPRRVSFQEKHPTAHALIWTVILLYVAGGMISFTVAMWWPHMFD